MSSLSVIVPSTDSPPTLERCLAAIAGSVEHADEVIVVDGPSRLSASAARNCGAARAIGEVLVFVDADVAVHPRSLGLVRSAFAADPGLTALFGSYDDTPEVRTTVSAFRNNLHHHVHHAGAGEAETFWSGLGAVRAASFRLAGGFDDRRYPHPSIEDVELGDRLRSAGARILLDPRIQGTHLKTWTLRSMLWTDFARRGVPWVALQVRTRRLSRALNCGWTHRFTAAACLAGVAGTAVGEPALLAAAAGCQLGLNRRLYAMLLQSMGPARTAAGFLLHSLHHLVAVASVPAGIVVALAERQSRPTEALGQPCRRADA